MELKTSSPAADVDVADLEACAGSGGACGVDVVIINGVRRNWNPSVCAPRLWDMARNNCIRVYILLAVSISVLRTELSRPCGPLFSRPLRTSVRSFISIRQVVTHDLDLD